jgi:hypothetical protein
MNDTTRKLIGKSSTLAGREVVYQTAEGFEVERAEHYNVEELRVFFDDVHLVTIHREKGTAYLIFTGLVALFFIAMTLFFYFVDAAARPVAIAFGVMGTPAVLGFLIRAIFGVDVVTIFGRRSKAVMRFRFRKARARQVYGQVCAAVRQAQRRREPVVSTEAAETPLPVTDPQ